MRAGAPGAGRRRVNDRPSGPFDAIGGKPTRPKPKRWPRTPARRDVPRPPVRKLRKFRILFPEDETP